MNTDLLFASLSQLAVRIPVLIVYGVAIALAVARWNRHPQVSMYVVIAMSVLTLELLSGTVLSTVLPMKLHESGRSAAQIGVVFAVWGIVTSVISAACWGLIIAAIFSARGPETEPRLPR